MSNPMSGYDLSAQVSQLKTQATSAAKDAISQSTGAMVASGLNAYRSGGVGAVAGAVAETALQKAGGAVAKSASEALQKGLGGVMGDLAGKVDGAAGSLAQAASKAINAKLADSLFTASSKEDVLAVDAYSIKDNDILNSTVGKLKGFAETSMMDFKSIGSSLLGSALGGALGNLSGGFSGMLSGAADGVLGGLSMNVEALKDRVGAALSGVQSSVRGITDNVVGGITDSLGIPPQIGQVIQIQVGNMTQDLLADKIQEAKDLTNVVNQITGNKNLAQFFDVGAESALLSMVFNDAIRLNIPGAVDELFNNAKSNEAAHYALASNIEVATEIGDVDVLTTLTNSLGANLVLAQVPNAVHRVLAGYRFPNRTTVEDFPELWEKLNTALTAIKPGWGYRERNGESLIDLAYFAQLSPDAATLLHWQGPFKDYIGLRDYFRQEDLHDTLAGMYPRAVISLRK